MLYKKKYFSYLYFSDLRGNCFTQRPGTGQSRRKGQGRKCKSNLDFSFSLIFLGGIFIGDIDQMMIILFHKIYHFLMK